MINKWICPVEFKIDSERNVLEGYASVFGNIDIDYEVMDKGAFKKTIKERVPAGLVKIMAAHGWNLNDVMGSVTKAHEDDHGLHFIGKLSEAPSVQDSIIKMKEGFINRLSVGFSTIKERLDKETDANKRPLRHFTEVKWYEVSPVPFASNEEAVITDVKALVIDDITKILDRDDTDLELIKAIIIQCGKAAGDGWIKIEADVLKALEAGPDSQQTPPTPNMLKALRLKTELNILGSKNC